MLGKGEMSEVFVLDTHVLIWYFTGNPRLRPELRERIDTTREQDGRLLVPTIVLAEALYVAEKGKARFDFDEMHRLVRTEPEFEIISFTPEILEEVIGIRDIPELHDRIIAATGLFYGAGIMTKDRVVRASGEVDVL